MTDEQINTAIHKALGRPLDCPMCSDPECIYNRGLNYSTDLNAMHEAEEHLMGNQFLRYAEMLDDIIGSLGGIRATARQRAEAFLRTLGKWEEVQS